MNAADSVPPISRDDRGGGVVDAGDASTSVPRIEGFQVVGALGAGGMGAVYRAIQLSTGRTVALKLLRGAAFGSARALARFQREVELLARLEHPHIARLYHSGQTAGCGYFAMELVEGSHLDDYVREHHLSQRQVLELMVRVCRAVDHAHRRGVIHRDLKPSNILVDADGQPHILDFGLAKLAEPDASGDLLTEEGVTTGTLHFMSPEQAAGRSAAVDTRSDVYSLGVILYRLLTHRLPHPQADASFDMQRAIIETEPPRPRSISRAIGADLEAVILKALAKDPDARYPAAGQLADDLENDLSGEPVRARRLTAGYFLAKRLRRHWASLSVAAAIMLLLVGGAVASYIEIGRQRDRAQASAEAAEHALYLNRLALARAALDKHDSAQAASVLDRCPPDLRQWEWHYLRKLADSSSLTFTADEMVRQLTVDPHAAAMRVVTTTRMSNFNLQTGEPIAGSATDLSAWPRAVLSGDGRHLLCIDGSAIDMRDVATGAVVRRFTGHAAPVRKIECVAGEWVVSVDEAERVLVWSVASGRVRRQAQSPGWVAAAALSDAGGLTFLVSDRLHLLRPEEEAARLIDLPGIGRAVTFGPSGDRLLVGGDGGWACLVEEARVSRTWSLEADVLALAVAGGRVMGAAGTRDGRIYRLNLANGGMEGPVCGLGPAGIQLIAFLDPDGQALAASAGATVKVWRFPEALPMATIRNQGMPGPVRFHPAGHRLMTLVDGQVVEWDVSDGRVQPLLATTEVMSALAYGPGNGQRLAHRQRGPVVQWEDDGSPHVVVESKAVMGKLSEGGRWFIEPRDQGRLAVHDLLKQGASPRLVPGRFPFAINTAGTMLAAVDPDDPARVGLWSLATGQAAGEWIAPAPHAEALAFSGDGKVLASMLDDGRVLLWDVNQRAVVGDCVPQNGIPGHILALNRDGSRLLTLSPSLSLYDARSGQKLLDLLPRGRQVYTAAFGPAGRTIAVSTMSSVSVWSVR